MMCSPEDPLASCADRREAERRGDFYWDEASGAWYLNNTMGACLSCPYCDGDLPDLNNPGDDGESFAPVHGRNQPDLPWGFRVTGEGDPDDEAILWL